MKRKKDSGTESGRSSRKSSNNLKLMGRKASLITRHSSLSLQAPAKINWFLEVLGKRDDGYHEIQSLLQKITLYDVLRFTALDDKVAPGASQYDNIIIETGASIPVQQNLVYKAAVRLKSRYGIEEGAVIHLEKNIPMGAGLGGGSSDAAAALQGLNELWSLGLTPEELCDTAEELGSDVPFFLQGPLSYVHGRGEQLIPRKALGPLDLLLVKPSFDVSTEWVYKNFALLTKKVEKVNNIEHFIRKIERAELSGITDDLSNDLESVTVSSFPVIAEIKDMLHRQGAVFSLMSGSGSAVFGVFESRRLAEEASLIFSDYWTAVVETII
ncbi:MAG: 4-(cytidine 5'-diphospho)-2-C-methyl-D-erythritol kinase [Nitrospiraceae bacterium]|nr:MAG: 4-(cytidine 5'-diphospho)-2-C-methyl-D-erythritol kinase [Nitrospiraceae bacterium]